MCEFPGCSKAFSNASDRAKHQNRTHSNEVSKIMSSISIHHEYKVLRRTLFDTYAKKLFGYL